MSYKATHWAWEIGLKMPEKFVLIALADMADEKHSCFPGQATLSQMTGASESTVRRAVRKLEDMGLLVREERRTTGGYRTSDRYLLQVGAAPVDYRSDCAVGAEPTGQRDRSYRSERTTSPVRVTGTYKEEPPENNQGITSGGSRKRATRIPDEFFLTAEMKAWAAAEVPGLDVVVHTREFVDYWRAESGAKATKLDWVATWRNWMRKAHRWNAPRNGRATPDDRLRDGIDRGERLAALMGQGEIA